MPSYFRLERILHYWSISTAPVLTVAVSLAALVVSILLGLIGAAAKLSGKPAGRRWPPSTPPSSAAFRIWC
jgi:ABC-type amino acid transport system permease subunit